MKYKICSTPYVVRVKEKTKLLSDTLGSKEMPEGELYLGCRTKGYIIIFNNEHIFKFSSSPSHLFEILNKASVDLVENVITNCNKVNQNRIIYK